MWARLRLRWRWRLVPITRQDGQFCDLLVSRRHMKRCSVTEAQYVFTLCDFCWRRSLSPAVHADHLIFFVTSVPTSDHYSQDRRSTTCSERLQRRRKYGLRCSCEVSRRGSEMAIQVSGGDTHCSSPTLANFVSRSNHSLVGRKPLTKRKRIEL